MRKILLGLVLSAVLSGCGVISEGIHRGTLRPMGGVKMDCLLISRSQGWEYLSVPLNLLLILDLPFCFLYDSALLPATIAADDGR